MTLLKFGEGLLLNLPKKGSTADTAPIDFGEEEAASRDGEGDVFGPQLKAKVKINSVSVGMLNGPPSSMIYGVCAQVGPLSCPCIPYAYHLWSVHACD